MLTCHQECLSVGTPVVLGSYVTSEGHVTGDLPAGEAQPREEGEAV